MIFNPEEVHPLAMRPIVSVLMKSLTLTSTYVRHLQYAAQVGQVCIAIFPAELSQEEDHRPAILQNMQGVTQVCQINTDTLASYLLQLQPNYVVLMNDQPDQALDQQIQSTLKRFGGTYLDLNASLERPKVATNSSIQESIAFDRVGLLKKQLNQQSSLRLLQAHDAFSARIVEESFYETDHGTTYSFDAIWSSSLADAALRILPDSEQVSFGDRLLNLQYLLQSTHKPIVLDFETGGPIVQLPQTLHILQKIGVSAIVMEDKITGHKQNSLYGTHVPQQQSALVDFVHKLERTVQSRWHPSFIIIARIESLILEKGLEDAIHRAKAYLETGIDGILIHSRQPHGDEIKAFAHAYAQFRGNASLWVIPTTYHQVYEDTLIHWGCNAIVYANHLIRAAYPAMQSCAKMILKHQRAFEAEAMCVPVMDLIRMTECPP